MLSLYEKRILCILTVHMDKQKAKEETLEFLKKHVVAILATSSKANAPHAAALYYIIDDDFNFFFTTKSNTQKFANITENNKVALVVVDHASPKSVEIEGTVDLALDDVKQREVVDKISEKSAKLGEAFWPPPISQLQGGELIVFKVTPSELCFCDYRHGQSGKANILQIIP